jgi:hypothetical protein
MGLGLSFSFLVLYTVGRTPWTGDRPEAATYTQAQNKRTQTSMCPMGFEPTISASEREATVIGQYT